MKKMLVLMAVNQSVSIKNH